MGKIEISDIDESDLICKDCNVVMEVEREVDNEKLRKESEKNVSLILKKGTEIDSIIVRLHCPECHQRIEKIITYV